MVVGWLKYSKQFCSPNSVGIQLESKPPKSHKDDCSHGLAAACIDRFISVKMARRYLVNSLLNWRIGLNQTDFRSCRTLEEDMEEIKSEQMYMEDLDGWILEENKVSVISIVQKDKLAKF